jgi:hypothetical protein
MFMLRFGVFYKNKGEYAEYGHFASGFGRVMLFRWMCLCVNLL